MERFRERVRSYLARIRTELDEAIATKHTPKQVAASFALGVFITALPTLGTGLIAFVIIAYLFSSVSKIALFASVLVLNPVVKWGVYASSFWLGNLLLGPVPGVTLDEVSLSAAPEVVIRLLVGNLIIAVVLTVIAYALALRFASNHQRREVATDLVEEVIEKLPER